jgi:hypothetical protein
MEGVIYILSALTSLTCALLLLRGYRRNGFRLLLWSGLCFAGFTLNNVMLFVDFVVYPKTDLFFWRNAPTLAGLMLLLYGLIWEADR